MKHKLLLLFARALIIVLGSETHAADLAGAAAVVAKDYGKQRASFDARSSRVVAVLSENHVSVVGQIEQAIMLNRLYGSFGMRDIALEGFLVGTGDINTKWFSSSAKGDLAAARRVAVQLLKEGEISAAEFMVLIYSDVEIHPVEKATAYDPALLAAMNEVDTHFRNLLVKIAKKKIPGLGNKVVATSLKDALQMYNDAVKLKNDELIAKYYMTVQKELDSFYLKEFAADPWLIRVYRLISIQGQDLFGKIGDGVEDLRKIKAEAASAGVLLTSEEERSVSTMMRLLESRERANEIMLESCRSIVARVRGATVALIIGAGHAAEIESGLRARKQSFYSIYNNSTGDYYTGGHAIISDQGFTRKAEQKSIYKEGLAALIDTAVARMKPRPIVETEWFKAKAELYLFTDRIAHLAAGGSGNGPPSGTVFTSLGDGEFRGDFVYIDPRKIEFVDDEKSRRTARRSVVFPVILNYADPRKKKQIWGKAALSGANVAGKERESVEAMLKQAMVEAKEVTGVMALKVEDDQGRVKVTLDTIATFGEGKAVVAATALSI